MIPLKRRIDIADRIAMRSTMMRRANRPLNEPCCDFCGSLMPMFLYASRPAEEGLAPAVWRWAVCAECAVLLDHEEFDTLQDRITAFFESHFRLSRVIFRVAAELAIDEFRRHAVRVNPNEN